MKFTINITVWKNLTVLNVSNNCTKRDYPIKLKVPFDFDKYYNFEVQIIYHLITKLFQIQGITLYKLPHFQDYNARPFKLSNRQGFLVRGTIEGSEAFSLYFRQDLGDGKYALALELTVRFDRLTSTIILKREVACKEENGCEKVSVEKCFKCALRILCM